MIQHCNWIRNKIPVGAGSAALLKATKPTLKTSNKIVNKFIFVLKISKFYRCDEALDYDLKFKLNFLYIGPSFIGKNSQFQQVFLASNVLFLGLGH